MRAVKTVVLLGALLGLAGAAPDTRPDPGTNVTRLQAEVQSLRMKVAQLEAENRKLRGELAVAKSKWFQPQRLPVPRYLEPVPIPPDAVPHGQGNVRHYVIPVEEKEAGTMEMAAPTTTAPAGR